MSPSLKGFHHFNTHPDSQFKPSPASLHQKHPREEDVRAHSLYLHSASDLWGTSASASALFEIWSRGEGCLCICRYLTARCIQNNRDPLLHPHSDSLWQQLLTVSESVNTVCVFSEVVGGWLFTVVAAVRSVPCSLLQKSLQGTQRIGIARTGRSELDSYL